MSLTETRRHASCYLPTTGAKLKGDHRDQLSWPGLLGPGRGVSRKVLLPVPWGPFRLLDPEFWASVFWEVSPGDRAGFRVGKQWTQLPSECVGKDPLEDPVMWWCLAALLEQGTAKTGSCLGHDSGIVRHDGHQGLLCVKRGTIYVAKADGCPSCLRWWEI